MIVSPPDIVLRVLDSRLHVRTFEAEPAPLTASDDVAKTRRRTGGKAPASKLLAPVDRSSRRGEILRFVLDGGTVAGAMARFVMTRPAVLMTFATLNGKHGIGYASCGGEINVLLPKSATEESIWR